MHAVEEGLLFFLQVRATRGVRVAVSVSIGPRTSCDRPAAKPLIDRLGYSKHDRSFVLLNEGAIDLFL
ncbi:hypothetical protein [Microcoleus sp. A003_D6]|uniref:hypothetical protein n=1 Tax=Microcoleus sp. A003_D6 TaxID=3055266 RepID=UPI002FD6D077